MNKKGRCVVVSAAEIKNYEKISSYLQPDDYFVVCDGGLNHCKPLGIKPDLIVGDFDSFDKAEIPLPAGTDLLVQAGTRGTVLLVPTGTDLPKSFSFPGKKTTQTPFMP